MTAIDWRTPLATLSAAMSGAAEHDRRIGGELRSRLISTGGLYDRLVPPGSSAPSVLTESAAHAAWRSAFGDALAHLDQIGVAVDSGGATSIGTSTAAQLRAAETVVVARLEAAREIAGAGARALIDAALATPRPVEPRFFVRSYYRTTRGHRLGDLEAALSALVAAVDDYLAVI